MAFSQNFYETKWKAVAENYQQGLYKSNLPIILEIQKQATKDGNTVELIRSLKAEFVIINQTQNDDKNDITSQFFDKISTVENALKGEGQVFLYVIKGEFVNDYYQNNYWRFQDRTNVSDGNLTKIETWSKLDFKNYLEKFYANLEKKKTDLKKIKMAEYARVFEESENISYFPTLQDWASINTIQFFQNAQFFTPNERNENQAKIENIYDDLIISNSGNSKLYFQHQKLNTVCSFTQCKDRFEQLEKLVENESTKGDYKVLIIEDIVKLLMQKEDYKLALTWINDAKEMYPKSQFLNNLINKENQIKNLSLEIHYEQNTLPNQPIHLEVNAKNTKSFSLDIYEVKDDFQNFLEYSRNSYDVNKFNVIKKTLIREEKYTLPEFSDYKNHQTALEIKALPAGIYLAEYKINNEKIERYYFLVSSARIISEVINSGNKKPDVMKLVDRNTGKVFANKTLNFYKSNNEKPTTKFTVKTDAKGNFEYPKSTKEEYYKYYLVEDSSNNSFQIVNYYDKNYYNRNDESAEENKYKAQIFIDRGIYRPGQIVYFKVINTKLIADKESVAVGISQEIILNDANGEEISKQKFTTNEFGSYNGSFTLPNGKLNGQFSLVVDSKDISDDGAYKVFQVEEYKRPKFEITFEPIKEEYKYGQTVEVTGTAKMFSGVALSDATVKYEIKKQNIRWQYFSWFPRNYGNENSILGEVKTDGKGEFKIKLKLEKDETIEGVQIDNYAINGSVTDINGETQTSDTNVKVASVSHYINIENNEKQIYFSDEKIELKIQTKNYNDQNLKKSYHAKLSKFKPTDRIIRENFMNEIQDASIYSKAEFVQKFPHDYFDKSEKVEKIEKVLYDKIIQPKENNVLDIFASSAKLGTGKFELELYNIEGKDTIKTTKSFEVFDKKSLADSQKPFLKIISEKSQYKRSENPKIYVYSAIPDALINIFVQNGNGETQTEQKKTQNGLLIYDVKSPKDEKVNVVNVQFQLVAYNDVRMETKVFTIINEEKPMRIETVVFRDKLQPGQKEKWTLKVLGNDASTSLSTRKEKLQAEVLANMYDKSLDQFAGNYFGWQKLKNSPNNFQNYDVNDYLTQKYYQRRLQSLKNLNITSLDFKWNDYQFFNNLIKIKLENRPNADVLNIAQGQLAGVNISTGAGQPGSSPSITIRGKGSLDSSSGPLYVIDGFPTSAEEFKNINSNEIESVDVLKDTSAIAAYGNRGANGVVIVKTKNGDFKVSEDLSKIEVRENLNETAFFYPNLVTDKDGNINFEFTSPEALTQWKVMFLAHTKDARSAYLEKSVITQKEFSVTPNYPRFLREGDEIIFQSKLSSLVDKPLNGTAQLQILDAFTNEDITDKFVKIRENSREFVLQENGNSVVKWIVKVPKDVSSIIIKVVAVSTSLSDQISFSDGEQKAIAVLPNRMLVTDAVPIFVKEGQTKTFSLENLVKNTFATVQNFSNTLELTTNPIWEIMFALPSLKTDDNQSADVIFNKWFADVVASEIFKANPKLKTIFEEYQSKALLNSNLEKNQELKQLLLEETPWVLESQSEEEQMAKLAKLFEVNSMKNSIQTDWKELQQLQNSDGGFSWYKGYESSYYNSLYILKNLGKLNLWLKGNTTDYQSSEQKTMVAKLVNYVDNEVNKYYENTTSLNASKKNVVNNYVLDYLDTRNYWEKEYPLKQKGLTLKTAVIDKAKTEKITDFTFFGLHRLALLFNEYGEKEISEKFLTYLKETSTETQNQGVYWKQNLNDWGWYNSKISNHAGAIEAFQQLAPNDINFIEEMKIWLITQKEVNSWGNSRNTAEVIFTILNSGKSWTESSNNQAKIIWGGKELVNSDTKATGYVKSTINSENLDKNLGSVTITKSGAGIVQGGLYWQYFEDLDKIKSSESYISITKELYKKVKTVNGEELQKITENSPLKIGDKVTVRMILNTDRNMEYIHLKDMRAAGFEPLNVISGYEWKNNLGYYQSTKDASTNFYIQNMPKGKYVFEYDYICNAAGTFSNGITTLQNYYASQMNAHSEGINIKISE